MLPTDDGYNTAAQGRSDGSEGSVVHVPTVAEKIAALEAQVAALKAAADVSTTAAQSATTKSMPKTLHDLIGAEKFFAEQRKEAPTLTMLCFTDRSSFDETDFFKFKRTVA